VSINSITIQAPGFHQTNTCGSGVEAGKNCTITVTFSPLGQGFFYGHLYISDNGGGSPQSVSLAGFVCRKIGPCGL
jgi:hypothetical protein